MPYRRAKPDNPFTPLGTVVDRLVRQYRPLPGQQLTQVWEVWEEAAGPAIAAVARPAAFKGNMLLIHVSNSAWLHQLHFLEKELLANINRALGAEVVAQLKFKIGPA